MEPGELIAARCAPNLTTSRSLHAFPKTPRPCASERAPPSASRLGTPRQKRCAGGRFAELPLLTPAPTRLEVVPDSPDQLHELQIPENTFRFGTSRRFSRWC